MLMKQSLIFVATALLSAAALAQTNSTDAGKLNTLNRAEAASGWTLLFDGKTADAWRGYHKKGFPETGWKVENGCLHVVADGGGGDIITKQQYTDFELAIEWKASPQANSGIIYRASEELGAPWQTGPEYQILDDAGSGVEAAHKHAAGSLFDIYAPAAEKKLRPVGEFNQTRILIYKNHVTHWLNGVKVLEYDLDSDAWKQAIASSKFAGYEGFGMQPQGHIALQDHGHDVWFRNIKIREIGKPLPGERALFDGKSTTGWGTFLSEEVDPASVWTIEDGVLICHGKPAGYIFTKEEFANFVLKLEWRWSPVTKQAGNSGVLLRVIGENKVWPDCVEAQLQSGNAGDFWNIGEFPMKTDPKRLNGLNTKKMHFAEKPIGEWNAYEIYVNHGDIVLYVNGELVNSAWDVKEVAGKIALQSEGTEIHFRDIRIAPVK